MKNITKLVIMVCIVLVVFNINAFGAGDKDKRHTSRKREAKSTIKYDESQFDMDLALLPRSYRGHSLDKVFNALDGLKNISKNEFETTKQYNDRLKDELDKPLVGNVNIGSTFVFTMKPNAEYDADSKAFHLKISEEVVFSDHMFRPQIISDHAGIMISSSGKEKTRKYMGMNSYGATAVVSSSSYTHTGLAVEKSITNYEGKMYSWSASPDGIMLQLDGIAPDLAAKIKDDVMVLFAVKLKDPYVYNHVGHTDATLSSPYNNFHVYRYVSCEITDFWIYNLRSGAVYKKIHVVPQ